jgi:beta-glucosidase-like glycosyl hydrolase
MDAPLRNVTCQPAALAQAASFDVALVEAIAAATAVEPMPSGLVQEPSPRAAATVA